uniref:Uncharacterized protein n=1 Tax=Avena sativa TaxID=4498 RepID=A0ACD5T6V2_AVESA
MSGAGGGDHGGGQLYGNHQPAPGFHPLGVHGDDVGSNSIFFQNSACGAAVDDGGGATPYSSITDYLQFLDPAGLPRHLDAPPAAGDAMNRGSAAGDAMTIGGATAAASVDTPEEEGDEQGEIDEEGSADRQDCRGDEKKQNKKKGKVEKKVRGSRVAFATKSEVDHLDDGYRWRKYGQKAVKNSSFPRSYYRCTAARCGVKKQVERSQQDPSTVVTTYEGQHAHPSPAAHRGMAIGATGLYSLASLQQQRHGFCPTSPDDLLLAAARAMAPAAAAASPGALLPRQAEHQLAEYYGMQLQDLLHNPLMSNQHGHRR